MTIKLTAGLVTYLDGVAQRVEDCPVDFRKARLETFEYKVNQLQQLGYDIKAYQDRAGKLRLELKRGEGK